MGREERQEAARQGTLRGLRRRRAAHHGRGPGVRDPEGARARRPVAQGHGRDRDQRGLRQPGAGLPRADEGGLQGPAREPERRRHRHRPPARLLRRPPRADGVAPAEGNGEQIRCRVAVHRRRPGARRDPGEREVMNAPEKPRAKAKFVWEDPLLLEEQLSEDERMVRDAARKYCQDKLAPRVLEAFRNEKTDPKIFREIGELGLLGPTIPEQYGGPGLTSVSYGLSAREVERIDSGYRSMMSVQSSMVMVPTFEFGSSSAKQKYLPKLATGEWIGSFGLTEPNHG